MIEKIARTPRKDPTQEKIVSEKDVLNHRTSKVIDAIKALKKAWNGGPSPSIGLSEKINLTQPMPDQVISIGNAIASEFSSIINDLKSIDNLQDAYSVDRSHRLEEREKKLEKVQSVFLNNQLYKIASNPLTRTWSHIVAPFYKETNKWQRLTLLRSLADIEKELRELDEKVLSQDVIGSIVSAKQIYKTSKATFFEPFNKNLVEMLENAKSEYNTLLNELKKYESVKVETPIKEETISESDLTPLPIEPTIKEQTITVPFSELANKKDLTEAEKKSLEAARRLVQLQKEKAEKTARDAEEAINKAKITQELAKKTENIPDSQQELKKTIQEADIKQQEAENALKEQRAAEIAAARLLELQSKKIQPSKTIDVTGLTPLDRFNIIRKHISESIGIYKSSISKSKQYPAFWHDKLAEQKINILNIYKNLSETKNIRVLYTQYGELLKVIGAFVYLVMAAKSDLENKNKFQYGENFNQKDQDVSADNFFKQRITDLNEKLIQDKTLTSNGTVELSLISEASGVSRWFKRMMTHLSSSKDKNVRIHISNNIIQAIKSSQNMMNVLERRNLDFKELIITGESFYQSLYEVFDKLADLAEIFNSNIVYAKSLQKSKKSEDISKMIPISEINELKRITKNIESDHSNISKLTNMSNEIINSNSKLSSLMSSANV